MAEVNETYSGGEDEILPYRCIGVNCNYCIPFNSETEYFHGTSDDCPEKYK